MGDSMVRTLLLALVVALSTIGSGMAGPFEDGVAAYRREDYATALRLWKPLAEQGDARAQTSLGVMYMYDRGQGVPQDYAEALRWYRKAAEQGHARAQNNLGGMYENGRGVPQDYVLAHVWFNLSASRQTDSKNRELTAKARDRVAAKMTPTQITEAQRRAREWKPTPER